MYGTICTQQWNHDCQDTHDCRQTVAAPTAIVVELGEDVVSTSSRAEDPESDQYAKEAEDVDDQHNAFHQRQFLDEESVEDDGEGSDRECQQCPVPSFGNVVWIIQNREPLNLRPGQKCCAIISAVWVAGEILSLPVLAAPVCQPSTHSHPGN